MTLYPHKGILGPQVNNMTLPPYHPRTYYYTTSGRWLSSEVKPFPHILIEPSIVKQPHQTGKHMKLTVPNKPTKFKVKDMDSFEVVLTRAGDYLLLLEHNGIGKSIIPAVKLDQCLSLSDVHCHAGVVGRYRIKEIVLEEVS